MTDFYAAIDDDTNRFCVIRRLDGLQIAFCDSEDWSCYLADVLNLASEYSRTKVPLD